MHLFTWKRLLSRAFIKYNGYDFFICPKDNKLTQVTNSETTVKAYVIFFV